MRAVIVLGLVLLIAACVQQEPRAAVAAEAGTVAGPPGLRLPASFTGTLPCADCEGILHRLDLWPDGVFHLQRTWLGTPGTTYDVGRWRQDPGRPAIELHGLRETLPRFEVKGPESLRLLDRAGLPIQSALPYTLTSNGVLSPLEMHLPLHGMFTYMADAPRFEECLTGRSYPVAMKGEYLALERAYLAADKKAPGAPVMAYIDGDIGPEPAMEGDGQIPTVSVRRFIGLFPEQSCARTLSTASLTNTYWRIVTLGGQAVAAMQGHREPHLLLRTAQGQYVATAGCNQLSGGYEMSGSRIDLHPGVATRMACPGPLESLEQQLVAMLGAARTWRLHAQVLELFDVEDVSIATLEAVYLP